MIIDNINLGFGYRSKIFQEIFLNIASQNICTIGNLYGYTHYSESWHHLASGINTS